MIGLVGILRSCSHAARFVAPLLCTATKPDNSCATYPGQFVCFYGFALLSVLALRSRLGRIEGIEAG